MAAKSKTTVNQQKKNFYDIDKIKAIPIVEVCQLFGIRVDYKGREPRCSIRSEDKTPSAVLHTVSGGKYSINTYHDFGNNETGDVISLACRMMGLDRSNNADRYQAMEYLANVFHIAPESQAERNPGELTDREYRLIGLYGDRASKNFSFDPDRQSIEQMSAISEKYNMPLNEMKKAYPRLFVRLLKTIAIPALSRARNEYYMYVWGARQFTRSVMGKNAEISYTTEDVKEMGERADELRTMERVLSRAMIGTDLRPPDKLEYEPESVLARIDNGELRPQFGNKTYRQMKRLAEAGNTKIRFRMLDLSGVFYRGREHFRDIPYSAFMSNEKAVVGYLERDAADLAEVFEKFALPSEESPVPQERSARLYDKMKDAKIRQANQLYSISAPTPQETER